MCTVLLVYRVSSESYVFDSQVEMNPPGLRPNLTPEEEEEIVYPPNIPDLVPVLVPPKLIWYQTETKVVIKIQLANVDDYTIYLDCHEQNLFFATTINGVKHGFLLHYWGAVKNLWTHFNNHMEIRVILFKARLYAPWLRLSRHTPAYIPITLDPDHIDDEDDDVVVPRKLIEREWDDWQEYKRKHNLPNPPPPSDSSNESDDEMMDALIDDLDT